MAVLLRLLRGLSQDGQPGPTIITVVTSQAASAAADLLTFGTYALAYPDSSIMFHGGRMSEEV